MTRRAPLASLLLGALALAGCAQVRGKVVAESVRGPVSLTGAVFDAQGRILTLDDGLEEVGRFKSSTTFIAAFYGLALPTWTWDASEELNEALDRYQGEAVINLRAVIEEPNGGEIALAYLTQTQPMIPIWIRVNLTGKVVRRRHRPEEQEPPPRDD